MMKQAPTATKWNTNYINKTKNDQEKKRTKSESMYAGTMVAGSAKNAVANNKKNSNVTANQLDNCASSRLTRPSDILEVRGES